MSNFKIDNNAPGDKSRISLDDFQQGKSIASVDKVCNKWSKTLWDLDQYIPLRKHFFTYFARVVLKGQTFDFRDLNSFYSFGISFQSFGHKVSNRF